MKSQRLTLAPNDVTTARWPHLYPLNSGFIFVHWEKMRRPSLYMSTFTLHRLASCLLAACALCVVWSQ